jgi:hypothetical protein
MLFSRRQRQRSLAEREAAGESFWTRRFSQEVRNGILYAALDASGPAWEQVQLRAHGYLVRAYGVTSLAQGASAFQDLHSWVHNCDDTVFADVVEALDRALGDRHMDDYGIQRLPTSPSHFRSRVGEVLSEHRVAFDFLNGQMQPFDSRELFAEVVSPALTLLAGSPQLKAAEHAYQDSLRELAQGNPADAITDATTALSEALKASGCTDNSLAAQARTAQTRGLLTSYDVKLFDWAQADRFNLGDAHQAETPTTRDDAWLMVHIVGAIIVRLSGGLRG